MDIKAHYEVFSFKKIVYLLLQVTYEVLLIISNVVQFMGNYLYEQQNLQRY